MEIVEKLKFVRSALYVPGSNARALEKARSLDADMLIFDLEDAVPPADKDKARATRAGVRHALDSCSHRFESGASISRKESNMNHTAHHLSHAPRTLRDRAMAWACARSPAETTTRPSRAAMRVAPGTAQNRRHEDTEEIAFTGR